MYTLSGLPIHPESFYDQHNRACIEYICFLREIEQVLEKKGLRAAFKYHDNNFSLYAKFVIEELPEVSSERYNFEFNYLYKTKSKMQYMSLLKLNMNSHLLSLNFKRSLFIL